VYVSASVPGSATVTLKGAKFPEVAGSSGTDQQVAVAGSTTGIIVAKLDAAQGTAQWLSGFSHSGAVATVNDLKVDDQTGAVFITGGVTKGTIATNEWPCNPHNSRVTCGFDLFRIGHLRRAGCPVDPRPVQETSTCWTGSALGACNANGLLFKEVGLPYCMFVPFNTVKTGYVAKLGDGSTDAYRRTLISDFGTAKTGSPAASNVEWFKVLGNAHGSQQAASPTFATSEGLGLAIHDSDVYVVGAAASLSSSSPQVLQFPGVHTLGYSDTQGLQGDGGVSAFIAKMED